MNYHSLAMRSFITMLFFLSFAHIAKTHEIPSSESLEAIIAKHLSSATKNVAKDIRKTIKNTRKISEKNKITKNIAQTDSIQWIKTASGTVGGSYFVLGELIGGVISHPIDSLECNRGGTCGISGLQSLNITSHGSQSNIASLKNKVVTTGFVQSDLAYLAYKGLGPFKSKGRVEELRAIASLYPEAVHILVSKSSKIDSISNLEGHTISIGHQDSGTSLIAKTVLNTYNLSEGNIKLEYLDTQESIKKLKDGKIDAMFFIVGAPAPAIKQILAESDDFKLINIDGKPKSDLLKTEHYFKPYKIKADTYNNQKDIDTLSVYSLWLTHKQVSEPLVYELTKALWNETSKQLLHSSFIGQNINIENSLDGIGIPLHKGAQKYYDEIGKKF